MMIPSPLPTCYTAFEMSASSSSSSFLDVVVRATAAATLAVKPTQHHFLHTQHSFSQLPFFPLDLQLPLSLSLSLSG